MSMLRRQFMAGAAATLWAGAARAAAPLAGIPIIDPHMHLFDATRPQGAPYTGSKFYKGGISTPAMYVPQAREAGIVGAMAMEASPWIEDNLWLLEQIAPEPFFVGMVGMLEPDKPDFAQTLDRYRKNRLFRGIRYGKLWGFDISNKAGDPAFIAGLEYLAATGLPLDTANVDLDLLKTCILLNDRVPDLKIVLDHSPAYTPKPSEQAGYDAALKEIAGRPNIFTKISWNFIKADDVDHRVDGRLIPGLDGYKDRLDRLTEAFGEDRVMFCTNYPQSVGPVVSSVAAISNLAKSYYAARPRSVAEKFFWRNSAKVYKWIGRSPDQPRLS
jgi:predicted TIM-barrel fold metal-dependent hydrolase